jgi:hypothetical protein
MSERMTYVKEGSLAPPGPLGRSVRALGGVGCAIFLYFLILHRQDIFSGKGIINLGWLVGIAFAVYVFPDVLSLGLGKSWNRKTLLLALLGAAIIAASVGWVVFESPLAPPLGIFIYFWLIYTYAHLGIALLLASMMATPGCEMRSIPSLWARITGNRYKQHLCPGAFTPLDGWEAARRAKSPSKT